MDEAADIVRTERAVSGKPLGHLEEPPIRTVRTVF